MKFESSQFIGAQILCIFTEYEKGDGLEKRAAIQTGAFLHKILQSIQFYCLNSSTRIDNNKKI